MDRIVLSAQGISKTETGYMVSDPDLLYKNFGQGAIRKKILDRLALYPEVIYSYQELADELGLSQFPLKMIIRQLVLEGKVIEVEKPESIDESRDKRHDKLKFFRFAK